MATVKKINHEVVKPPPTYLLELTEHEAEVLVSILYRDVSGTDVIVGISRPLFAAGVKTIPRVNSDARFPPYE